MTGHPIHFLWATPRSTSTAFEWMMRQRGDLTCFHEPFGMAWHQGPEARAPRPASADRQRPEATFKNIWNYHGFATTAGGSKYQGIQRFSARGCAEVQSNASQYRDLPDIGIYREPKHAYRGSMGMENNRNQTQDQHPTQTCNVQIKPQVNSRSAIIFIFELGIKLDFQVYPDSYSESIRTRLALKRISKVNIELKRNVKSNA